MIVRAYVRVCVRVRTRVGVDLFVIPRVEPTHLNSPGSERDIGFMGGGGGGFPITDSICVCVCARARVCVCVVFGVWCVCARVRACERYCVCVRARVRTCLCTYHIAHKKKEVHMVPGGGDE